MSVRALLSAVTSSRPRAHRIMTPWIWSDVRPVCVHDESFPFFVRAVRRGPEHDPEVRPTDRPAPPASVRRRRQPLDVTAVCVYDVDVQETFHIARRAEHDLCTIGRPPARVIPNHSREVCVSCRWFEPSSSITHTSQFPSRFDSNRILDPSGDHSKDLVMSDASACVSCR